jgi:hypothetical protein
MSVFNLVLGRFGLTERVNTDTGFGSNRDAKVFTLLCFLGKFFSLGDSVLARFKLLETL